MKTNVIALVLVAMAAAEQLITWGAVFCFALLLGFYIKIRYDYKALLNSDPVKMNANLTAENADLMKKLNSAVSRMDRMESEYKEMVDYRGRYLELRRNNDDLSNRFGELSKRFDKMQGELDHYKALFIQQRNLNEDANL